MIGHGRTHQSPTLSGTAVAHSSRSSTSPSQSLSAPPGVLAALPTFSRALGLACLALPELGPSRSDWRCTFSVAGVVVVVTREEGVAAADCGRPERPLRLVLELVGVKLNFLDLATEEGQAEGVALAGRPRSDSLTYLRAAGGESRAGRRKLWN